MNVKDIRRKNCRSLASSTGGISSFAKKLGKSQSQISHLIGKKPIKNIGDKLASQIEITFNKMHGWLDKDHDDTTASSVNPGFPSRDSNQCYYAPLLSWEQVCTWPAEREFLLGTTPLIPSQTPLGRHAFAIKMQGDCMESPYGIGFPEGCTILIDPELEPTHESYVLAKLPMHNELMFNQLLIDGERRYLKALNPRYPTTELTQQATICGVARQMLIHFN
jgi:SOS-response transcriptional repressor LexA